VLKEERHSAPSAEVTLSNTYRHYQKSPVDRYRAKAALNALILAITPSFLALKRPSSN